MYTVMRFETLSISEDLRPVPPEKRVVGPAGSPLLTVVTSVDQRDQHAHLRWRQDLNLSSGRLYLAAHLRCGDRWVTPAAPTTSSDEHSGLPLWFAAAETTDLQWGLDPSAVVSRLIRAHGIEATIDRAQVRVLQTRWAGRVAEHCLHFVAATWHVHGPYELEAVGSVHPRCGGIWHPDADLRCPVT